MDKYELRAIVFPAVVAMVIPGIFIAWVFQDYLWIIKDLKRGLAIVLEGVLTPAILFGAVGFFFRNLFRSTSKFVFQFPFFKDDESFMPTTNYLFWNDNHYTEERKKRIYAKIFDKYHISLPLGKVKKKDELVVRKRIAETVCLIRRDFKEGNNKDSIVLDYNIQFGMFRNYLGGAFYACCMIIVAVVLNAVYSFTDEWISSVLVIVVQTFLIATSIISLKVNANDYAKQLIDYFEQHM